MFDEVGLDAAKREQWHKLFETRYPAGHESFLAWLGFKPEEIENLRARFR